MELNVETVYENRVLKPPQMLPLKDQELDRITARP